VNVGQAASADDQRARFSVQRTPLGNWLQASWFVNERRQLTLFSAVETRNPSLEVAPTTLATIFSRDRNRSLMTLIFGIDLDVINNQHEPTCQVSRSKVI